MDPITQQTPQPSGFQTAPVQPGSPITGSKKVGPIIAALIVVLVLIVVALYLFASRINQEQSPADSSVAQNPGSGQVEPVTNTADDVSALESDLNASTNGLESQSF